MGRAQEIDNELKREGFPMLLKSGEACQALRCARSTLSVLTKDGLLKPTRLQRDLRFRRSQIAEYLASGMEQSDSE